MKKFLIALIGVCLSQLANADLKVYEDYDIGKKVIEMTTVKIDSNMGDKYLEGLRSSLYEGVKIAKKLGYIEDFKIYASELPESGDFNMILMTVYKSGADLEPSKEKYQKFMNEYGKEREKKSQAVVKTYPEIRTLTGQYRLREITFIK